jgi:predicted transcriptional regulator
MTKRTLVVTVGSVAEIEEKSQTTMAQNLEEDPPSGDDQRRIAFESTEELCRVFSPDALGLLRTISQERPETLCEAARLLDRDNEAVLQDLARLERYEVIEYDRTGQSERPVVLYDDIQIHLGPA